ncbi:hypothetical protein BJ138DRAFT_840466 [Hygrophoropsis aurantiaca]|uniref:Uncharacterized protein n=1 Tax=Hygrophoropsis aurantiaca TaxID=72124 RepID=A0ACB7ZVS8_9AGAM|nr:hypothetical protein BJ138DRAFT_840466 [Hygrophoropsis aurantiaca]
MSNKQDFALSTLSLNSNEDWDRSESDIRTHLSLGSATATTPRNSVAFPAHGMQETPTREGSISRKAGRSLSELLKLHAEEGTDVNFSAEEASRVADVLNQWINSSTSPYEGEDDFFTHSQDDSSLGFRRSLPSTSEVNGRPRGQSESIVNSRPLNSTGGLHS